MKWHGTGVKKYLCPFISSLLLTNATIFLFLPLTNALKHLMDRIQTNSTSLSAELGLLQINVFLGPQKRLP
jgi:hypothetical protein